MKMLKVKKIKVGQTEFHIKLTTRAMIEFEELSGSSIANFSSTGDIIKLFYCTAKAGAKSEKVEFKYSFEEFLDIIDEYPTEAMTEFTKCLDALSDKKKVNPQK